ncbi:MFS transporter [Caproicibacterium lactatifermentans]|uniref:MFS transporter n=2 Tax=Oscillospiraceae TaxID=216572 RepID=A0A859DV11_9FIRM|nr:MFS transporter [Caproicibacterium lactatifermentans]QKO31226.1 MFS transporter [Caproicibacterium lactatifermentans]
MDMSTEMIYPIIPLYLTAVLGATPAIVGVIEGVAESVASLLKVASGYIGDRYQNKKRLAFLGYSASVLYKFVLLIAGSWGGVLAARVIDRTGKGIRTAPRDALVAQSSEKGKLGGSYGLHKMLDMAGSSLGALFAFLFIAFGMKYRAAFLWSVIPGVVAVTIIPLIREEKGAAPNRRRLALRGLKLDARLKWYFAVLFLFCLGNSSNVFLLLKAQSRGFSTSEVMLLYLIFSVSASILAIPAGRLSDRFGRSRILIPGYLIYGLVYLGFALLTSKVSLLILFVAYGAYTAFISGAERALIAEASPADYQGTVLGIYGMLQGFGLLLSSMIGGVLGIVSALLIAVILRSGKGRKAADRPD